MFVWLAASLVDCGHGTPIDVQTVAPDQEATPQQVVDQADPPAVVINEVRSTDGDTIELLNLGEVSVDLGHWSFTDERGVLEHRYHKSGRLDGWGCGDRRKAVHVARTGY